ncbi:hypothetical protein [Bradyrhizobium sp. dw_78]|uniref:hypothetical protein n=1 Tax=Bradyrhizobium sp. dw_78 TaxID=2719793 RepID=UPI001BD4B1A6|nr:hypothetical protein [Bradyrhizobium sp. dw_78]
MSNHLNKPEFRVGLAAFDANSFGQDQIVWRSCSSPGDAQGNLSRRHSKFLNSPKYEDITGDYWDNQNGGNNPIDGVDSSFIGTSLFSSTSAAELFLRDFGRSASRLRGARSRHASESSTEVLA